MESINKFKDIVWVEISRSSLRHNAGSLKKLLSSKILFAPVIKSNAYGHGIIETARILDNKIADWFCVNSLWETAKIREAGIKKPLLVLGYSTFNDLELLFEYDGIRITVYNIDTLKELERLCKKNKKKVNVHLKVETGTGRQGVTEDKLDKFINFFKKSKFVTIEGISTHFANIEDTTDHSYAEYQLKKYNKIINIFYKSGIDIPLKHTACSAAVILFKKTYFNFVRPGISLYGLWPSNTTFLSCVMENRKPVKLEPVLTWKTRIAQIKEVPQDYYIGYGCTYKTTHKTKLAILPVGYYDGYDRGLSNIGYVLIKGKRAPVLGRVCMNIIITDVTHIKNVRVEDEAVLLGKQGNEEISADTMASMLNTINYEVVTRINSDLKRVVVN